MRVGAEIFKCSITVNCYAPKHCLNIRYEVLDIKARIKLARVESWHKLALVNEDQLEKMTKCHEHSTGGRRRTGKIINYPPLAPAPSNDISYTQTRDSTTRKECS